MKKIILLIIFVIILGVVIVLEVNVEEKNYELNVIVEFMLDIFINKLVDLVNLDIEKFVEFFDLMILDIGNKLNEGIIGLLSIDYVFSLDFGKNKILNKDEKYYVNL